MSSSSSLVLRDKLIERLDLVLLLAVLSVIFAIVKYSIGRIPITPQNFVVGQTDIEDIELQQFL